MITTIEIDTIEQALGILSEQEYDAQIKRFRSPYFSRGEPDAAFRLKTTLSRNCKSHARELEPALLRNFTKYAVNEDPTIEDSVWRQMIVGRHHGLPTRTLDWSHSPLIALHFTTTGESPKNISLHDSVIWRIDMDEVHSLLPQKYRDALNANDTYVFDLDMLSGIAPTLEEYDRDMGSSSMVFVEPPSIDQRIINQYSFFGVVPGGMQDIESFLQERTSGTVRYIIKKEIRWRIREMLDQLNVNERMVYPGLDGLSSWLARHYYVSE